MEIMKTDNLVRVSTYAKSKGITPTAVYLQVKQGKVKIVEIDGMKFVDLKESI